MSSVKNERTVAIVKMIFKNIVKFNLSGQPLIRFRFWSEKRKKIRPVFLDIDTFWYFSNNTNHNQKDLDNAMCKPQQVYFEVIKIGYNKTDPKR